MRDISELNDIMRQYRRRVVAGTQCPECSGIRTSPRINRFQAAPDGFGCDECGCNWGTNYFGEAA